MLQQTRASVVVPYFNRWMERFPDVETLAASPLEAVIKAWEGLGYYSRVRNLHAAARQVVSEFGGKIPCTKEALSQLKGLGPYTIGALLSFGFHQRAAAVDGNVLRVLSRYYSVEENICRPNVRQRIEQMAEKLLDEKMPWITAEALIELGASICVAPRPRCEGCPLQAGCLGMKNGKASYLPIKNQPAETIPLHRVVAVVVAEKKVLLKKGEAGRLMADLYEFPYCDKNDKLPWNLEMHESKELKPAVHTFTRYKAHLYPRLFRPSRCWDAIGYCWISLEELQNLPFSSGHKKIMRELCESYI